MKLVSYRYDGRCSFGRLEGDLIASGDGLFDGGVRTLRDALDAVGPHGVERVLEQRQPHLPLAAAELLPPVPDPRKILCVGLNYRAHQEEASRDLPAFPVIFPRFADSQVGHGQPLLRPAESQQFDYEGELAVVIGHGGRRIPEHAAMAHVAGYSCYNDGSVRDWQRHTHQWLPGKTFPGTGGFGPVLVTAADVADHRDLTLTTKVNGEILQLASVGDMIFDVRRLISYISTFTALSPGDVIVTGTPAGVGAFREPPRFLADGDLVEVELTGIGTLANTVHADALPPL